MLKGVKKALQELINKHVNTSSRSRLPKAAPSAEEAILPFNPAEYAIQPRSLKRMIDDGKGIILLDVREEWEYRTVYIDGARWIPLGVLPQRASELNPYAEIVIYCHRGMRSLDAAYLLQQLGFKRVKSLVGGIDRWAREINPTLQRY
jgi:sulfur-carrier protein adenylyltransferase/sulfurtransferase